MGRNATGRDVTQWRGTERDGAGWNGNGREEVRLDRKGQDGIGGARQDGTGTERD